MVTPAPRLSLLVSSSLFLLLLSCTGRSEQGTGAATPDDSLLVVRSEFVYETASFPSAHASTIVETPSGLVAAWFGGTDEGEPDVGIWLSRNDGSTWSAPEEVATGVQSDGSRHPCWNPVLVQPAGGPLLLFYKVGPNPRAWWGLVRISPDDGVTWSEAVRLPDGVLGPIRAKPVFLPDGSMLAGSSTEHDGWVVHMERYLAADDPAETWSAERLAAADAWEVTAPLNDPDTFGAIQPTILQHESGRLQILCRSRQGVITQVWSDDGGATWGPMTETTLPNPSAGIDAVRLADGRFLLIYNPTRRGREQLGLAVSSDGETWARVALLEDAPGEYSYPAMILGTDGRIHLTYTWRRERIRYAVVEPSRIGP